MLSSSIYQSDEERVAFERNPLTCGQAMRKQWNTLAGVMESHGWGADLVGMMITIIGSQDRASSPTEFIAFLTAVKMIDAPEQDLTAFLSLYRGTRNAYDAVKFAAETKVPPHMVINAINAQAGTASPTEIDTATLAKVLAAMRAKFAAAIAARPEPATPEPVPAVSAPPPPAPAASPIPEPDDNLGLFNF